MTSLDYILLLCFVPSIIVGLRKGLVDQVIGIASTIIGVWLAFKLSQPLAELLGKYLPAVAEGYRSIVCFAVVVVLTVIGMNLLGKALSKLMDMMSLNWLNRLGGLLFSLAKTALILSLLIFIFEGLHTSMEIVDNETLQGSVVYGALRDVSLKVFPYLKELISSVNV